MKQLTNDQIYDLYNEPRSDAEMVEFANAVISEFCRTNGITGEAQPAEQANGREAVAFDVTIQDDAAKMLHTMVSPAFDGDEDCTPIRLLLGNGHLGYGLYVASADYPEEGAELLTEITTPPAQAGREWVGLTDDEIHDAYDEVASREPYNMAVTRRNVARALESKLREKNAGLPAAVPDGYVPVPVDALTRWRDAFAEELAAYDIDPPIRHVLTSHDEIAAMLAAAPKPQPQAVPDDNRCIRELREYAAKNPGTYIFPGWDGNRVTKYLAAAPKPQATTPDDHPLMHSKPAKPQAPDMEASE